jgi:hypothetical protein
MSDFTISQQDYESLIALARRGATDAETLRSLDSFLKYLEKKNGITRYGLWVQWQEAGKQVPITVSFPQTWPAEMRHYIELITRPIAKADVMTMLTKKARKPLNVLVTPDPAGLIGWTALEAYFPNG